MGNGVKETKFRMGMFKKVGEISLRHRKDGGREMSEKMTEGRT